MAATSGDYQCQTLLGELLSKGQGAAVAAALPPREVAIDIVSSDSVQEDAIATEGDSVLHVVAAAGDGKRYLESAEVIYGKARQLLVATNSNGDTPLHCAALAGNRKMVARLIDLVAEDKSIGGGDERARELLKMQNKRGETALHEAVRFGDTKMVKAILKMDTDKQLARLDAKDGTSPLYLACSLGHREIPRKLHEHDKMLSYSGPHGQNALHAAVLNDKSEVLLWLHETSYEIAYV
ncbi:hypothetical protein EJB05_49842, partial [Eragrostis curvula]